MPFDSLGLGIETESVTDPLERLSITPVPADFVKAYMKDYRKKFMATRPRGLPGPFVWRRRDFAEFVGMHGRMYSLEFFMRVMGGLGTPETYSTEQVPSELVALAERVEREVPNAGFSIDYFDRDPILNVHYGIGAERREACLGIWDRGTLVAIADTTRRSTPAPATVAPPGTAWFRFWRSVRRAR